MRKPEYLDQLRHALSKLPEFEIEKSVSYFSEMIDDRIEGGETEEDAVSHMENPYEAAFAIIDSLPAIPKTLTKAKTDSKPLNIILLIVGSPLWVPLVLALILTIAALYLSIWAFIVSLWAVVVALVASSGIGLIVAIFHAGTGNMLNAVLTAGTGFMCAGLGIFAYFGVLEASKGLFKLTRKFAQKVKSWFVKEEALNES